MRKPILLSLGLASLAACSAPTAAGSAATVRGTQQPPAPRPSRTVADPPQLVGPTLYTIGRSASPDPNGTSAPA